jgi:hypothetical protein
LRAAPLLLALLFALPSSAAHKRKPPKRVAGDDKSFAAATISFAEPADQAVLDEGVVRIDLHVSKFALPSAGHLHVIVDNEPALTVEKAGPLALHGLARGPHLLRAVLCLAWHEVVKAPHAFAMTRFWVGPRLEGKSGHAAEFVAWPDPKKPMVTYVLPIGEPPRALVLEPDEPEEDPASIHPSQAMDAGTPSATPPAPRVDRPVLDFYLSNAKLARRGDKLRVVLDKRELPLVTEWKPQRLRRAKAGRPHKITIDLLNRKGLKVKNAVNRTDRAFVAGNG